MNSQRGNHSHALLAFYVIVSLLLLSGCDRATEQADIPKMDRLELITDADLVIRCSDTSALVAALEGSPLGRLWNSPEMKDLRADRPLEEHIRQALIDAHEGENAAQINEIYWEQIKMLNGEFILGLTFDDFDGEPEVTMVAAISEADFNRSLEMDDLLHALENEETISASEDFHGMRIYTYIEKKDGADRFSYQAFHAGTLVLSGSRTWLEQALLKLMETPAREPEGDPVLAINGRAKLMDRIQARMAAEVAESNSPFDLTALVNSLGIDTLGDMRMQLCLRTDRADMTMAIDRRGEWNRGLMLLMPPEPVPVDLRLAHVPPDVASYQVIRLDLNAFWMQLPEIMRQVSPEFQMQFSLGVNAVGGMMGINIHEDIFNNLDTLAFNYARFSDQGQEFIYGLTVRDADAMDRTLQRLFAEHSPLAAQISPFYRRADIQGHSLHVLALPVPEGDGTETNINEVGLTVIDRALVIGTGDLLMDYVQAAVNKHRVPAFYESPVFEQMAARIPAEACGYGVSDISAYVAFIADEIRSASAKMEAHRATPANADEDCGCEKKKGPLAAFFEDFDSENLPSTEVMARYFGTSVGYNVIDEGGFRSAITIHYPQP